MESLTGQPGVDLFLAPETGSPSRSLRCQPCRLDNAARGRREAIAGNRCPPSLRSGDLFCVPWSSSAQHRNRSFHTRNPSNLEDGPRRSYYTTPSSWALTNPPPPPFPTLRTVPGAYFTTPRLHRALWFPLDDHQPPHGPCRFDPSGPSRTESRFAPPPTESAHDVSNPTARSVPEISGCQGELLWTMTSAHNPAWSVFDAPPLPSLLDTNEH